MLENMKNVENSLIFVNFITGLTDSILGVSFFIVLRIDVSTVDSSLIPIDLSDLSVIEIFLVIVFVFIGFFVYGIRYYFFEMYRIKVFPKVKERQKIINEKRKQKNKIVDNKDGKEEGHTFFSRFIKYAFRNGTTVEECIAAKKKSDKGDLSVFDWIKKSDSAGIASFNMWKYANFINNRHPNANIYRFYYHSEIYQCLDTLFLLMFLLVLPFLFIHPIVKHSILSIKTLFLFVYDIILFVFHRISKNTGKACIRRFFWRLQLVSLIVRI